jgi:outer membrane biogenesis lipoprotein LolB
MRFLIGLISFFLLVSCSGQMPREQASNGKEKKRVEQWKQVLVQKMNERQFRFIEKVTRDKKVEEFTGVQYLSDWSLKDKQNKLVMEKKGKEVFLHYSGRTEKMTPTQAGLVSPKDHLMLMKESGIIHRILPSVTFQGKKAVRVEIMISPEKLANQMKSRLNTSNPNALMQVFAKKWKVVYQVVFHPESKKLLLIRVQIRASSTSQPQEIIYQFS